jgi:response regulator RpfG family c-di-GMP phosphodiesterase
MTEPPTGAPDTGLDRSTPSEIISAALHAAREMLGMDMAYVADTRAGLQDYRALSGDATSFGAARGEPVDLAGTYCELLLEGRLPNIVNDAASDPLVRDLPITERARIGSYIGVPIVLSEGGTYGTFCCLSHDPDHDLRRRDVQFLGVLARLIADQIGREEAEAVARRAAVTAAHVSSLLAALAARDGYTEEHSQAVVDLAVAAAARLGLTGDDLAGVEHAALLHDIGKIGVSDAILRNPGGLSDEEWQEMRRHPEIGEQLVGSMPGVAHLAPIIRAEHERWDGAGYPDGLAGEDIPLASRLVLVCDAYHAMTSDRPYRRAMTPEAAVAELAANAGTQFCPRSVDAVLGVLAA